MADPRLNSVVEEQLVQQTVRLTEDAYVKGVNKGFTICVDQLRTAGHDDLAQGLDMLRAATLLACAQEITERRGR